MDGAKPMLLLLVQVGVIIALARAMGLLFARMRQPQVIGEMLAGILLGPTLLGAIATPNPLFPESSIGNLETLSQFGVVLFLFLVGLEFDPGHIRGRGRAAAAISGTSVAVPFAMGFGLAYLMKPIFSADQQANMLPSALFLGAAISVTAFPVLARILAEQNLTRTRIGVITIAAAAFNDVIAWVLLAVVVAMVPTSEGNGGMSPWARLGLAMVFVGLMIFAVRPLLKRVEAVFDRQGRLSQNLLAAVFLVVMFAAAATEGIGVHALFGAFIAGTVMPKKSAFVRELTDKLEDFTVIVLLPLFFAYAGLKTDLRTIFDGGGGMYMALVIGVACAGKFFGAAVPALLTGHTARESLSIGALMNTRGLMELIILTIGLQLDVITPQLFGIMVVMALLTTGMTAPLLALINPRTAADAALAEPVDRREYSVLIPVARPDSGGPLLRAAAMIAGNDPARSRVVALHLNSPESHESLQQRDESAVDPAPRSLTPLMQSARDLKVSVRVLSFTSRDVPSDIARVARHEKSDLILMGYHMPVFSRAILGGTVHRVLTGSDNDVAVFVDRGFRSASRILVPVDHSEHDALAIEVAGRISQTTEAQVTLLVTPAPAGRTPLPERLATLVPDPGVRTRFAVRDLTADDPIDAVIAESRAGYDLVIVGVDERWGLESQLFGLQRERLAEECPASLLLTRRCEPEPPTVA